MNKFDKAFWQRAAWVAPTVGLALIWVMSRVGQVLPKIMGDELTYSTDARHLPLAQSEVPNYLFNIVFSTTNVCGYGFYGCAKTINMFFLVALCAVIYLAARLFAGRGVSFAVAMLTMLGPISSYVSYFTPDLMFYFAASLVIYYLLKMNEGAAWWRFALIGAGIGLVTLIKPHGLFLIGPIVLFVIYLAIKATDRRVLRGVVNTVAFVATTFVVKLGLGFAFAGQRGLVLFGGNYDGAATKVVASASTQAADLVASTASNISASAGAASAALPTNPIAAAWSFASGEWVAPLGSQLLFHLAFVLIFFGLPVIVLLRQFVAAHRSTEPTTASDRLAVLVTWSAVVLLGVCAVFVAAAPAWGEMISDRVMVRYYEYILPFVALAAITDSALKAKFSNVSKWVWLGSCALVFAVALPQMNTLVPPLFTDSSLIASVLKSGLTLWTFAILTLVALFLWFRNAEQGAKTWAFGMTSIIVLVFAISSYVNMTVPSSIVGVYTHASRWAHDNLTDAQKHGLIIYGNVKPNVQQAQFWVDDASVTGQALPEGAEVDLTAVPEGTYILAIGNLGFKGNGKVIHQEDTFLVAQVTK
jgi:phosphoglycerol transferase